MRAAALVVLLASGVAQAGSPTCTAFVIPPNVQMFHDSDAKNPVAGIRYRAVLGIPEASLNSVRYEPRWDENLYVARDKQAAEGFSCKGDTFILDKKAGTLRVAAELFQGAFQRVWIKPLEAISFEYEWPGPWASQDVQGTLAGLRSKLIEVAHGSGMAATPKEAEEGRLSRLAPCAPLAAPSTRP